MAQLPSRCDECRYYRVVSAPYGTCIAHPPVGDSHNEANDYPLVVGTNQPCGEFRNSTGQTLLEIQETEAE